MCRLRLGSGTPVRSFPWRCSSSEGWPGCGGRAGEDCGRSCSSPVRWLLSGPLALTAPFPDAFVWDLEAVTGGSVDRGLPAPPEEHAECDATDPGEVAAIRMRGGGVRPGSRSPRRGSHCPPARRRWPRNGARSWTGTTRANRQHRHAGRGPRVLVDWPVEDREGALSGSWKNGSGSGDTGSAAWCLNRFRIWLPNGSASRRCRASLVTRPGGSRAGDGHGSARDGLPVAVELPDEAPLPFVTGVGEGLGLEWGPRATVPAPAGLPEQGEAALIAGYQRGMAAGWRGGSIPELVAAPDRNLEEDRWWGPVPAQLCRCRVACE